MNGSAELLFYDHAGRQRIELTSTESYSALLNLKDDAGGVGATMEVGASKDGMPSTIAASCYPGPNCHPARSMSVMVQVSSGRSPAQILRGKEA